MPSSNGFAENLPHAQTNFDIPDILLVQFGKQLTTIIHHPPKESSISVLVLTRVYQISCEVMLESTPPHTHLFISRALMHFKFLIQSLVLFSLP